MKRLVLVAALAGTAAADPGFTVSAGAGTNVGTPFVLARAGRRFARAPFFELFADYSYDKAISAFSFQTFGVGVRTYLARWGRVELFAQATAGLAISEGGTAQDPARELGDRLLGPVFTQGVGVAVHVCRCWSASFTLSTGDPVWLRPELAATYSF
jgi:hypothetical protein